MKRDVVLAFLLLAVAAGSVLAVEPRALTWAPCKCGTLLLELG